MKKSIYKPLGSAIIDEINIIEGVGKTSFTAFPIGYPYIEVIIDSGVSIEKEHRKKQIYSYLCGQFVSPFKWRTHSHINKMVAVQIHPWALKLIFNQSSCHFQDSQIPLHLVDSHLAKQLEDAISKTIKNEQLFLEIENIFHKCACYQPIDKRVIAAWLYIVQNKGDVKIVELATHVSLSQRRLQQLFKTYFGIGAKKYSKIVRTQYYIYQLLTGSINHKQIPLVYFDQAHFIHELKSHTGMTPRKCHQFFNSTPNKREYLKWNIFNKY
ncbi:helix-turn-helix domain-containing protein [Candidatus Uabimicrobium sp. HlEnr_7]|uniref:helix-turn-helix domain-containing protein n=1 Tax=Candidatus Uabimicrobium helgolandensis TaxID=3095367 RepID=UPI003558A3FE